MWLSGLRTQYSVRGGCGFDPWPHSVGQGSPVAASCSIGHRCRSDPALPWLWRRPAAAPLIQLLAWELPYVEGVAIKKKKKKNSKSVVQFSKSYTTTTLATCKI